ncbi:MAG: methionine synthase [Desulfobulbus propionicus]|nr:MAG: methionine synthase [Desulfobulbus propionicus]
MIEVTAIDQKEIYRYLGYGDSTPDSATARLVNETEKQLLAVISPRYIYRFFQISPAAEGVRLDNGKLLLPGTDISAHLQGCRQAALMAATLSTATDRLLRKLQIHDMARAAVANSAANTAIEQVCDAVAEKIHQRMPTLYQTFRFSPGYGDLPIHIQKDFLNVLDAPRKIGLVVTPDNIMVPEKSISAIIGLSEQPLQKKRRGCRDCNLREHCMFRLKGAHCAS